MRLADLQSKEIVNINTGKNMGKIVDVEITDNGEITYFVVEEKHIFKNIFRGNNETNVKMTEITKIGEDVILVDL